MPSGASRSSDRWSPSDVALAWMTRSRPSAASAGRANVDADRRRHAGPPGIDIHERDLHSREAAQQAGDAATDHAGSDHGDPVTEQWRGIPQGVDGGLDRARQNGTSCRHVLGNDGHRSGRHHVCGLVRIQAEHGPAAQLRRSLLHRADVEVAILDRPREVPLLKWRPHGRVLGRWDATPEHQRLGAPAHPERRVRTITSSRPGWGRVTGRISPTPGARSQNACASACAGLTLPDPTCRES